MWDDTEQGRRGHFLVLMTEQVDAHAMVRHQPDRRARGRLVVAALRQTAERSQAALRAQIAARGTAFRPFWIANLVAVEGDRAMVEALAAREDVWLIEPDRAVRVALEQPEMAADTPAAPAAVEWGLAKIRATNLWGLGYTGQTIVYANADTGVQWDHPALKPQYRGWDGTNADHNYNWWDAIHSDISSNGVNPIGFSSPVPGDDDGHGTHTMGIGVGWDGGANRIGVAPGSRWIACRNMEEGVGRPSTYIECLQFFLAPTDLAGNNPDPDRRPDVVGNSYTCPPDELCAPNSMHVALENLRAAGIFMAVAAGNAGTNCGNINEPPGLDSAAITVGATTSSDGVAWFSSRGPVTIDGSNLRKPDLVAPGEGVRSAVPPSSYATLSGTSMAAPHLAGAVALLWSALPHLRGHVDETQALLEQTAVPPVSTQTCGSDRPGQIPNNVFGFGRIDVLAAYQTADFDADGLPDYWELNNGLNPTNSLDALADADGDGMSNLAEYLAGTNPQSAASLLRIRSARWDTNGHPVLVWDSVGGLRYRVQYLEGDLHSPAGFLDIVRPAEAETDPAPPGAPSTMTFTDDYTLTPPRSAGSARYYRIKLLR